MGIWGNIWVIGTRNRLFHCQENVSHSAVMPSSGSFPEIKGL